MKVDGLESLYYVFGGISKSFHRMTKKRFSGHVGNSMTRRSSVPEL